MDLNLLVVFEALWLERNVTRAGRRLGLSQPATSGALARLREMLNDRLFVRGKRGLEPTARCAELAGPLRKALVELRTVVAGSTFEPASAERHLRVGAVDAAVAVVMPRVLKRTMFEAPRTRVTVVAIDPQRACELLDDGQLDLAISPKATTSATVRSRALYPVEFVVAVRPGHPLARGAAVRRRGAEAQPGARRQPALTRAALEAFPRVQVSFLGAGASTAAVQLGSFLAVPPVLAETDAWALLPRPYAEPLARQGAVATFAPPAGLEHPPLQMKLLWPEAQDAAPASRWLRGLIVEATESVRAQR